MNGLAGVRTRSSPRAAKRGVETQGLRSVTRRGTIGPPVPKSIASDMSDRSNADLEHIS